MASKIEARFFNVKRGKSANFMCFRGANQVGSVYRDGKQFWAFALNGNKSSDMLATFADAEHWLWLNYV
jgi:hypothetical protein